MKIILSFRAHNTIFINCALKFKYQQIWIKVKMVSLAHLRTPYRSYSRTLWQMTALTSVIIGFSIKVPFSFVKCNKLHGAGGVWWRSWLGHCTTSQKVVGSIPDGVIGIFHWHNFEIWEPQPPGTLKACRGIALPTLHGAESFVRSERVFS